MWRKGAGRQSRELLGPIRGAESVIIEAMSCRMRGVRFVHRVSVEPLHAGTYGAFASGYTRASKRGVR
jgi:hypothetical protein